MSTVVVETQTSPAELASWLRKGLALPDIVEDYEYYGYKDDVTRCYRGCCLFICLAGKEGSAATAHEKYFNWEFDFAQSLGISEELANRISNLHMDEVPAATIADALEQGTLDALIADETSDEGKDWFESQVSPN